jgi:hypothetical protein
MAYFDCVVILVAAYSAGKNTFMTTYVETHIQSIYSVGDPLW